jgi:hypothetical protein
LEELGMSVQQSNSPLFLEKLMTAKKVNIRSILLSNSQTYELPANENALVLSVLIYHTNGTEDTLQMLSDRQQSATYQEMGVASGSASGYYDGFGSLTKEGVSGWKPVFMPERSFIYMLGGLVQVTLLVWLVR